MLWNKTNCNQCHQVTSCPEKTRLNINYCGSQRVRYQHVLDAARDDCLSRRGLNFLSIKINQKPLQPVLA
jgi:hypothetical protein